MQAAVGRERDFPRGSKRIVARRFYDLFIANISIRFTNKKISRELE
jgi:hypothetical protein